MSISIRSAGNNVVVAPLAQSQVNVARTQPSVPKAIIPAEDVLNHASRAGNLAEKKLNVTKGDPLVQGLARIAAITKRERQKDDQRRQQNQGNIDNLLEDLEEDFSL